MKKGSRISKLIDEHKEMVKSYCGDVIIETTKSVYKEEDGCVKILLTPEEYYKFQCGSLQIKRKVSPFSALASKNKMDIDIDIPKDLEKILRSATAPLKKKKNTVKKQPRKKKVVSKSKEEKKEN